LGLLTFLPAAAAPQCAQEILGKAKQAMGGDAWDAIHSTYSKTKLTTSGLTGQAESWEDNLTGRYVEKYQLGPTSCADGFDGKLVWSQDSSGEPRAGSAVNAYLFGGGLCCPQAPPTLAARGEDGSCVPSRIRTPPRSARRLGTSGNFRDQ
jgi:hypothetical protein